MVQLSSFKSWLKAARLRTLPLALSSIILGGALAAFEFQARWAILALALVTALFLQILSNFNNINVFKEEQKDVSVASIIE